MIKSDQSIGLSEIDFNPFEEGKEIEKIAFTNDPQKEILLSCALGGDEANLAYNESVSLVLNGSFKLEYFLLALREVVLRHEALRATVSRDGETLIIYKTLPVDVPFQDISENNDQKKLLNAFITDEMQRPFQLEEGPLYRFFIHKLGAQQHYFTLILHHVIADGWSTGVILKDLSQFYNAKLEGKSASLEKAPQISDYADEQINFQQTDEFRKIEKYWLDLYKDNIPVLDFATDYPRPAFRTYKSKRIDHAFSLELISQIKKMGAKAGSSLVNTLLSAYEIFIYLNTNHKHIVVGLPAAGQAATEKHDLVGHCVNLLPIKSVVDPDLSVTAYLKNRKKLFFDANDHQRITFGQLINNLDIKRDHSRIPLVPVLFNVDMGMDSSVVFNGLDFQLISNPRACETFEISLNITGSASNFVLEWAYNTQLFKQETIEHAAIEFEKLMVDMVNNPDITIKELASAGTDVWIKKIEEWNHTFEAYPKDTHFTVLIDKVAVKLPHKTALVYQNKSLSYQDLVTRANQFAAYLKASGTKKGDVIGLLSDRSVEMVISLLGILKSGAVYVPLDPEYPKERIEYMLEDAQASLLLLSRDYTGQFQSAAQEHIIEEISVKLQEYSAASASVSTNGSDLAYILYTSGSTGKPKGVKIMHENLTNFLLSMLDKPGIQSTDRLLAITTISFDIAGLELYLPLITGAELYICDAATAKDGRLLREYVEDNHITFLQATPSTWRMMIDSGWQPMPNDELQKSYPLKALCGGEALPSELADSLLLRTTELWNMYGPTETTIWSTIKQITTAGELLTIGRPIRNTQIYIINNENELVAPGTTGEILIGGDGVALGYLNREELTDERFIDAPFRPVTGNKLYKTGDLGKFLENGEILYQGRMDQQVKIRGHRIELGEIETALTQLQGIKQAIVLAREDHPGDVRLVAYVILSRFELEVHKATTDDWKTILKRRLPDYMVPAHFIALEAFPLTPNNKIDKKALPKPEWKQSVSSNTDQSALNQQEEIIYKIWSNILGQNDIRKSDDFFELGGHSLLAVRVMTAIEQTTGKRLPVATLFENATIEKLAKKIQTNEQEKWNCLVPIKTTGTKDPIYLIHGAGLNVLLFQSMIKYLDDDQPVYGLQAIGLNRPVERLLYTIEEIATTYLTEVLANDPEGPYCFAGYSLGGKIAFEMARQLQVMKKEVKFLGVIDTYATNVDTSSAVSRLATKVKRQFRKAPFFFKSFLKNPGEAFNYQMYMAKYRLKRIISDHVEEEDEPFSPYELEIQNSYDIAYVNYVLKPSDLQTHLFRVSKRLYYLDDPKYLGWNKYAKHGVQIHEVPGDHRTFLSPPNDEGFAKVIQSALNHL
ncbi:non-ribosomal peptide synthetase [Pedobacter sp. MR2016-24]|uniref:non-ribosomal peptide synthetase n=1 Tax=Pedobacter sp. MR2016-24 TaxID=2994466 RepID=UPI002246114A|nr:non-ribosomal peptide synthetase [Pedobacter sp. MR2016-24]MCX2484245.1 amino acid adenylation domain-containing protein [Pedobacter sp. MR2016-24]